MYKMKNAKKPINIDFDGKNFDVKFIRDKEKGKTYIEIDSSQIDIIYEKSGNISVFKFDTESDILDFEIRRDEHGTTIDVTSKYNLIGRFAAWCLNGKARRARRRANKK
jgi:hypothetical protein